MADDDFKAALANAQDSSKGAALVGYYSGVGSLANYTTYSQLSSTPLHIAAFGAVGDGVTDDTAAFKAAYAALSSSPRPLWLEPNKLYLVTQRLNPLPENTTIYGNGSTIIYARSDASNSTQFSFGNYTSVINLTLHVPTGYIIQRFVSFGLGASADGLIISSEDQQPIGNENPDACIWAFGNNVRLRNIQIHNWEVPIRIHNPSGTADNVEIGGFKITSFGKGIVFAKATNSRVHSGSIIGKSPNAKQNPGFYAIGGSPGNGCSISDIYINETGEHGIYFSDTLTQPRGLKISNVTLENVGQCGIKIRGYHELNISGILVNDCAYENATGSNEDGLRLERCVGVLVSGYRVMKTAKSRSCYVGIVVIGCSNVYVNGFDVESPAYSGAYISTTTVADDDIAPIEIGCTQIYFNGCTVRNSAGSCIEIADHTEGLIGDISISGSDLNSTGTSIIIVDAPSALTGPISISGVAKANGSYLRNVNNSAGVNINLLAKDDTVTTGLLNRVALLDGNNFVPGANGGSLGTLALRCAGTAGQNSYGGSISFRGIGVERRKAAIASVQSGSNENQTGIAFLATDSTRSATDEVFEIARITGSGFRPTPDNNRQLGNGAYRWSDIYATTGVISTSDARLKTATVPLTHLEITCAQALAREVGSYKWRQSVSDKGDAARVHFGITVQRVIEVFSSHDLDPFSYGAICYDNYPVETETRTVSESGVCATVRHERPAGDVYSLRWDELSAFIIRGISASQDQLEARVSALEDKVSSTPFRS